MASQVVRSVLAALAVLLIAGPAGAAAFTYQGKLQDDGVDVDAGAARFVFRLYDADTNGNLIGSPQTVYPVEINRGIFTALIDFGDTAFNQDRRWLEIEVDIAGGTNYVRLQPRQLVSASPVAQFALSGGDSPWDLNGANISYTAGYVGVGTSAPTYPLTVDASETTRSIFARNRDATGTTVAVYGEATSSDARAIQGYAGHTSGAVRGVYGWSRSPNGFGVYGANTATSGNAVGVYGETGSGTGYAGYFSGRGYFSGSLGVGVLSPSAPLDVAGTVKATGLQLTTAPQSGYILTSDANGVGTWQAPVAGGIGGSGTASYLPKFTGTTTLGNSVVYESASGNVGIGTPAPSQKLHVLGTIRMNGLQLATSPQAGYVLTSDAVGVGTWQAPVGGGFDLPYDGSVTSSEPAFQISNSGTGANSHAVMATIDSATGNENAAAGWFEATGTNGRAIVARSSYQNAIFASFTGTSGVGISCSSSGSGGASVTCSKLGGYAVKGTASNLGISQNSKGGWFVSRGEQAIGVHAEAEGEYAKGVFAEAHAMHGEAIHGAAGGEGGTGVYASATGTAGEAIHADASGPGGIGLIAAGAYKSAQFYGNMEIYEYGTQNKVIELGKGLDYAEGFDVVDGEDSVAPGSVLVIDPENPGRLAVSRRSYDSKVAGIVAGANNLGSGVRLGAGQFDHDVALAGRVYCNVVALDEDVRPGDLLTTSNVPGYAMKVRDTERARGAILGKAMEPLAKGTKGQILVLVTLQ